MSAVVHMLGGQAGLGGALALHHPGQGLQYTDVDVRTLIERDGLPQRGLCEEVNDWRSANAHQFKAALQRQALRRKYHLAGLIGALYLFLTRANGEELWLGLASLDMIDTSGVNFLQTCFLNTAEPETIKYHALGTGTTAVAITDVQLVTEWTSSEYAARATGSLTTGGSSNVFRTVGTNTKLNAGASAVTECGLFTSATIGAVTLFDRFVFASNSLNQNDSLQSTIDITLVAGG